MSATASDLPVASNPGPAVWEQLVDRHRFGLVRYLQALGAAADAAEDLAQEAFLVALRRGVQEQGEREVGAFLRRTAQHLYLRARRDLGRREELLVEQADRLWQRYCVDDAGEGWLAALRSCVAELGAKPRAAVRLFYGEGRDRAAVAAALGMKENGFKTLLQRVRAKLRACVERRIGGGDE